MKKIIACIALWPLLLLGQISQEVHVNTVEDLVAFPINQPALKRAAQVRDATRGGKFEYLPADITATNLFTFYPTSVGGNTRWRRQVNDSAIQAKWGGDLSSAKIQAAADLVVANGNGAKVLLPSGNHTAQDWTTSISWPSGVNLEGEDGCQITQLAGQANKTWIALSGTTNATLQNITFSMWPGSSNQLIAMTNTTDVVIAGLKFTGGTWGVASGTQTRFQPIDDKGRPWTPQAFGCTADGVTDCTAAEQMLISLAPDAGAEIFFPPGTYLQTTVWITNKIGMTLRGENATIKQFSNLPTWVHSGAQPLYSAAFVVEPSCDNVTIDGLRFTQTGVFATDTVGTTGYSSPINIHLAPNVKVRNCVFNVGTGKAILSSGAYTEITANVFTNCGLSMGTGTEVSFLYSIETTNGSTFPPFKSPVSPKITKNLFVGSLITKNLVLLSGCPGFLFADNQMVDQNPYAAVLTAYSGDIGCYSATNAGATTADSAYLTNLTGIIRGNLITGIFTNDAAIYVRGDTQPGTYITTNVTDFITVPVLLEANTVRGEGIALKTVRARQLRSNRNDFRVTSSPLFLVGDCEGTTFDADRIECTDEGVGSVNIAFANGYLADFAARNLTIQNCEIIGPLKNEFLFRDTTTSNKIDQFSFLNNKCWFFGTNTGSAGSPEFFQLNTTTNWVRMNGNTFYVSNQLSGLQIGEFQGTNVTLQFNDNKSVALLAGMELQGPRIKAVSAHVAGNDVGQLQISNFTNAVVTGNYFTGGNVTNYGLRFNDGYNAVVSGNVLYFPLLTNQYPLVFIDVTNSLVAGNSIIGNTVNTLMGAFNSGQLQQSGNNQVNTGAGGIFVATTGGATTANHYEANNSYFEIASKTASGTRDAGLKLYVPNTGGNDTAGKIFFDAKDNGGTRQTFARIDATANGGGGFNKRGEQIFNVADVNGVLQEVARMSYDGKVGIGTTVPTSLLHVNGPIATFITSGGSGTLSGTNSTYLLNVDANTATLPTAVGISGRIYTIKLIAPATTGTVATTSSQTIDGVTTYSLTASNKFVTVQSDNAAWWIISQN